MLKLLAVTLSLLTTALFAQDYSEAERLLFLNDHLGKFTKPIALRYDYKKTGNLEQPAEDHAVMRIKSIDGTNGKVAQVDFLSGARKIALPETNNTTGNPILLNFLERETREMKRLTGGSTNYFRKRIRIALMEKSQVSATTIVVGGKKLAAKTVTITPYADDLLRERIGKFEKKSYSFTLSDEVPGEIFEMRGTVMDPAKSDQVLMEERITYAGTEK